MRRTPLPEVQPDVMALVAKRGRLVVTNIHRAADMEVRLNLLELTQYEKQVAGCIFGSVNSRRDIPKFIEYYQRDVWISTGW